MAHAKSGIRKLGHDLLVSVASTAISGARGCPVIARGTRVASYATRSTAIPVAGEYKYTVHVTRTRILLLVNTWTRDEQVCCAAAKTCMKNIVLAQLTKYLEYMLHTVSGYTVSALCSDGCSAVVVMANMTRAVAAMAWLYYADEQQHSCMWSKHRLL